MPSHRALRDSLARLETQECSVPVCERGAVALVEQEDGTLFPVCERHARKAAVLAFRVVRSTDDPSAWEEHELASPRVGVGDLAPDVRLRLLERRDAGEVVRIAAAASGRPIALVFGSYSVPKFRKNLRAIEDLHRRFSGRVSLFLVYTQEVQLGDWPSAGAKPRSEAFAPEARSLAERAGRAAKLVEDFGLSMPVLLDGLDHEVTRAFGGFPLRLYLIGADGRIVYQGAHGPYTFQPGELETAIRTELAASGPASRGS